MDFKKLFETQQALEDKLNKLYPTAEGENRFAKNVLALQAELMECANEWNGFKYWGDYDVPTGPQEADCKVCDGKGFYDFTPFNGGHGTEPCRECEGSGINRLLEEYVDCLHFALTIGLELGVTMDKVYLLEKSEKSLTERFSTLTTAVGLLAVHGGAIAKEAYKDIFTDVIRLGLKLGFTLEQIEQAYYAKNHINHERQASGY